MQPDSGSWASCGNSTVVWGRNRSERDVGATHSPGVCCWPWRRCWCRWSLPRSSALPCSVPRSARSRSSGGRRSTRRRGWARPASCWRSRTTSASSTSRRAMPPPVRSSARSVDRSIDSLDGLSDLSSDAGDGHRRRGPSTMGEGSRRRRRGGQHPAGRLHRRGPRPLSRRPRRRASRCSPTSTRSTASRSPTRSPSMRRSEQLQLVIGLVTLARRHRHRRASSSVGRVGRSRFGSDCSKARRSGSARTTCPIGSTSGATTSSVASVTPSTTWPSSSTGRGTSCSTRPPRSVDGSAEPRAVHGACRPREESRAASRRAVLGALPRPGWLQGGQRLVRSPRWRRAAAGRRDAHARVPADRGHARPPRR